MHELRTCFHFHLFKQLLAPRWGSESAASALSQIHLIFFFFALVNRRPFFTLLLLLRSPANRLAAAPSRTTAPTFKAAKDHGNCSTTCSATKSCSLLGRRSKRRNESPELHLSQHNRMNRTLTSPLWCHSSPTYLPLTHTTTLNNLLPLQASR